MLKEIFILNKFKMAKEKTYTLDDIIEARQEVTNNHRVIIEYLLNKNSNPLPRGIDYERFYEDMEDFCSHLVENCG
jgi:hypothetical protein